MIDFFRALFRPEPPSGATAKERLRLVLLSDHLSLAPDVVEALKKDLLAVISRYVEIDSDHADVSFEHREREVAMLASIPITGVRERRPPRPDPPPVGAAPPHPPAAPQAAAAPQATASHKAAITVEGPLTAGNAARSRRRRRKKAAAAGQPSTPVTLSLPKGAQA